MLYLYVITLRDGKHQIDRLNWYAMAEDISIVKPTRSTNVSNLFYFGVALYMFQTGFPSIIRCSRLYSNRLMPAAVCTVLNTR